VAGLLVTICRQGRWPDNSLLIFPTAEFLDSSLRSARRKTGQVLYPVDVKMDNLRCLVGMRHGISLGKHENFWGNVAINQRETCSEKFRGTDTCNFNLTRPNEVDYSLTNTVQKQGRKRGGDQQHEGEND